MLAVVCGCASETGREGKDLYRALGRGGGRDAGGKREMLGKLRWWVCGLKYYLV